MSITIKTSFIYKKLSGVGYWFLVTSANHQEPAAALLSVAPSHRCYGLSCEGAFCISRIRIQGANQLCFKYLVNIYVSDAATVAAMQICSGTERRSNRSGDGLVIGHWYLVLGTNHQQPTTNHQ